ncbi:5919_t:CDS:2, partial [Gigaspora rosea]
DSMESQSAQTEFRYIDGRRYHNTENAVYYLPNDENETDRLHFQHFLIRYIWQNNFSAPVEHILSKPGAKVLDIGYPLAKVIGLDISPHQPTQIIPKNFEFIKANTQERLPFDDNTFDFVFQRLLIIGYTKETWPNVINELVRVLKPGGYLELCEVSMSLEGGPATRYLWKNAENIKKEEKKVYYGLKHNHIELSKAIMNNHVAATNSLKPILTKILKISDEEFEDSVKKMEKELFEGDAYHYWARAYGRKVNDNN